jgi:ribosomal protein S18 acetylase RimI-like enzyme
MKISLRPAVASDTEFAERVFFATQRWIIEQLFGWRGDEFERRKFLDHYHPEITAIVIADRTPAGWLSVSWHTDRAEIESIYLLEEYQRLGIGSKLIEEVVLAAKRQNLSVCLSVAKINPARSLYDRLGFSVIDESEFKVYMHRPCDRASRAR